MNRKLLNITIILVILALVVAPAAAKLQSENPLPKGTPWDKVWNLLQDLQKQITSLTYNVDQIESIPRTCTDCMCPAGQFVTGFDSDGNLTCEVPSGNNLPPIIPLSTAGTPFNSKLYPQNTLQSDPMVFTCNWDGNGRVYISGDKSSLTGVYADDGYILTILPSGATFDSPEHWAHQHPVVELTSGMTPGPNTFTLVVRNWQMLSMSYGSSDGFLIDQTPYIIEVNSPVNSVSAAKSSVEILPSFITRTDNGLIVNGTLVEN